jgi:SecD/SecF fusion protein
MSEVLTRSLATTSCTLMPIIALLLFGGTTLRDFAFALLIGVASGAYSSIFIASPVLTHWKEREAVYRHRRERIEADYGFVPAYADSGADVEPETKRPRRGGRITQPEPDKVSAAEFEEMKRDLGVESERPGRHTSTLTKRLAHTEEADAAARAPGPAPAPPPARSGRRRQTGSKPQPPAASPSPEAPAPGNGGGDGQPPAPAPDIAENEGMVPAPPKPAGASKSRSRGRRHGRRR